MIALAKVGFSSTRVTCEGHRDEMYDALHDAMSYEVKGSEFSELRREGEWDGRKRLIKRSGPNAIRFPTGLWPMAEHLLDDEGFVVSTESAVRKPLRAPLGSWGSYPMREHQSDASGAFLWPSEPFGWMRGVLKMPIRSGKTLTAASIAYALQRRTLFIATSDFLVEQAFNVFREALPEASVTAVGGGMGDDASGDVVVISIATLAARADGEWFKANIKNRYDLVIADEVHHLAGGAEEWRAAVMKIEAPNKLGLSGTLDETDAGVALWARAICGPVLVDIPMREMVEAGYLMRANVDFVRYDAGPMPKGCDPKKWTRTTYARLVVGCTGRNEMIVREAVNEAKTGNRVLIDCSRVGHARELVGLLKAYLPRREVVLLTGSTKDAARKKALANLETGVTKVIVSTVLGEGVDIPGLEIVINAEGGRAGSAAIQRLRNLTAAEGKTFARIIEPMDVHHPVLADQTKSRAAMYRKLGCFNLRVV